MSVENDGGCNHRSGQRPSSGFVRSGDDAAVRIGLGLKTEIGCLEWLRKKAGLGGLLRPGARIGWCARHGRQIRTTIRFSASPSLKRNAARPGKPECSAPQIPKPERCGNSDIGCGVRREPPSRLQVGENSRDGFAGSFYLCQKRGDGVGP